MTIREDLTTPVNTIRADSHVYVFMDCMSGLSSIARSFSRWCLKTPGSLQLRRHDDCKERRRYYLSIHDIVDGTSNCLAVALRMRGSLAAHAITSPWLLMDTN